MFIMNMSCFSRAISFSTMNPTVITATQQAKGTSKAKARKTKQEYQSSMTLTDKIAQMAQIDIHLILNENKIDNDKIELFFGKYGVGSLLITPISPQPQHYLTASQYKSIIISIQNTTLVYNRPPVLIGIDSVHGANYIKNAILTPQQINIASTFNRTNAYLAGEIAGHDTRSAGITWIFSPILGLGMESFWSRMYETFGEDPLVVGEMGKAIIKGIQHYDVNTDTVPSRSAACAKHFVGYSAPRTGHDRSPSWIPRRHLHQYFLKPWKKVLSSKNHDDTSIAMTVMESYTEYNGVPNVANKESLKSILRDKLRFDGVLITDYQEVENLVNWHKTAKDLEEAVKLTLVEGSVDINMIPFYFDGWKNNVLKSMNIDPTTIDRHGANPVIGKHSNKYAPFPQYPNNVEMDRIDESVRRILDLKEKLNMFDEILVHGDDDNFSNIGSKVDRDMALSMAKESIILTKNENDALPIKNNNVKIHVTGPTADSIRYQSGGWTIQWQGVTDDHDFTYGTTVLNAVKSVPGWDVSSSCGVDILGNECVDDKNNLNLHLVEDSDYVIVCVGEEAYTEKPGDIRNLELPSGQIKFVKQIKDAMKDRGKLVVVYFGGRPRLLKDIVPAADAFLLAFLPGPDGGQAIVDILTGQYNPNAKLPITYPKFADKGGVPYWNAVSDMCTSPGTDDDNTPLPHWQYTRCEVEWKFGHGLSYAQFQYSNLKVSGTQMMVERSNDGFQATVEVTFKIKNIGDRVGSETIMLFLFVENRNVTPEHKLLWYFDKFELTPGEVKEVVTKLSIDHLRYIGPHDDTHSIIQPGMNVKVGLGPYVDCRAEDSDLCSESISVVMNNNEQYEPSCEAACFLWNRSGCLSDDFSAKQCWEKCLMSDSFPGSRGW